MITAITTYQLPLRLRTLTPIAPTFLNLSNDSIDVGRYQWLYAMTLEEPIEVGFADQDLPLNPHRRERVHGRVNPASQGSLAHAGIRSEASQIEPLL